MNETKAPAARTFIIGCVIVVAAIAGLGFAVATVGTRSPRPEGIAERWLADISNTTRSGAADDARHQADKVGPVSLATSLTNPVAAHGKTAFTDLNVGKAKIIGETARVPFTVRQRHHHTAVSGTITLHSTGSSWHITALGPQTPGLTTSGNGGGAPTRATASLFVAALTTAGLIAIASSSLIRLAGPPQDPSRQSSTA